MADWGMRLLERRHSGIFNATGADGLTMLELLVSIGRATHSEYRLKWVDDDALRAAGLEPFAVPFWLPNRQNGLFEVNNRDAIEAGLRFRPADDTAAAVLNWFLQSDTPTSSSLDIIENALRKSLG